MECHRGYAIAKSLDFMSLFDIITLIIKRTVR